ncbi:hypothetical protein HKX48_000461 [Thoreauomyces humboldtii]|nr:hypothetical protein HKX48_000461 [Thoreauomyces humboldtii]
MTNSSNKSNLKRRRNSEDDVVAAQRADDRRAAKAKNIADKAAKVPKAYEDMDDEEVEMTDEQFDAEFMAAVDGAFETAPEVTKEDNSMNVDPLANSRTASDVPKEDNSIH